MAGITAVLLPGLDGTGELLEPFVAAAPKGVDVILVRYPTLEMSMGELDQLAREKLTDRCVLIAESYSGPIGVRAALDARVSALVLCNSFVSSPVPRWLRHLSIPPVFAIPPPEIVLRLLLLGRRASPALVEKTKAVRRRLSASVVARRVRQVLQTDERANIAALGKPILYLRGTRDHLVSDRSYEELQNIRGDAEVVRIQGPHMLLEVAPDECWQAIQKFVQEFVVPNSARQRDR